MSKSKTAAFIRRSGNAKAVDTRPELQWDAFAKENYLASFKPSPIVINDDIEFKPDRGIMGGPVNPSGVVLIYIEIDGPYHWTDIQQRKTRRRDMLITTSANCRILHIHSELLMSSRYWLGLYQKVQKFVLSGDPIGSIPA